MESAISEINNKNEILRVTGTTFLSNTYICATGQARNCFVVDPGLDAAIIDNLLLEQSLEPSHIFCTHGHFDHIGSASFLQKKYGAKVFLHSADIKTMKSSNFLLMAFKLPNQIELPKIDVITDDEFLIPIGDTSVRYLHVAGHTPGSCIIQYESAVFTGDTLYSRGVGLSQLPKENPEQLRASLRVLFNLFSDDDIIYPGHGEPASFGWIRQNNSSLLEFIGIDNFSKDGM